MTPEPTPGPSDPADDELLTPDDAPSSELVEDLDAQDHQDDAELDAGVVGKEASDATDAS